MSAILAVCGDTFCAMVSDGRYVEEPITGEKPHILKNDLPKVRKINRNVVVGFAGDTLAAVQIINAVDEYQTQYLTLEKVVKILREKAASWHSLDDVAHTLDGCIAKMAKLDKSINTTYFRQLVM